MPQPVGESVDGGARSGAGVVFENTPGWLSVELLPDKAESLLEVDSGSFNRRRSEGGEALPSEPIPPVPRKLSFTFRRSLFGRRRQVVIEHRLNQLSLALLVL